ncbi:MAG: class I SAM-dependent methyltransferase [Candidatus Latescibacterota bacterium]|nr:MAG: class I SAM-dependent methyltransferase [Candidatus Latescibacterota bacterium]
MSLDTEMVDRYFSVLETLGIVSSERYARSQLEDLFGGIDLDNKRVLDIGGGSGVYSFYAACMGAKEVICLEPEADGSMGDEFEVYDRLRSTLDRVTVKIDTRTIQEYGNDRGKFDVILMHASINHLDETACINLLEDKSSWEKYRRLLSLVSELAAPGARLIVCDCSRYNFFAFLRIKNPLVPAIEWHKHQAPEVWARLLEEVGFCDPEIRWEPLYRFRKIGRLFLANKVASYFLKSVFCLRMTKA